MMNRRRQIRFTPEEQADFLRAHRKAALATIDNDGFPHVAMNFFMKDGAFYMTSYAKAQKVLNIRRNPKVALMVEAGDKYSELHGACALRDPRGRGRRARGLCRYGPKYPEKSLSDNNS
jgi:nitroimidazol reductase NimA-like FMN-containing flavoprotein (pyridoxamine 5'-phosphate oxidase superfamily)